MSKGELVQMINAETEALGGFVGDAVALPAFQAGTLLTSLFFMFMQDWKLGIAAIALYPLQMWLIPKLQRQVNSWASSGCAKCAATRRTSARWRSARATSAPTMPRVYERARFSEQLGTVFWIRFDIYKKKFLIKFLNNFISQLGPFFFFSIGGYLVMQGQITIGALDGGGRRAQGHHLAVEGAAELLPEPVRCEDQVRADRLPVHAAGHHRRGGLHSDPPAALSRRARSRSSLCHRARAAEHDHGGLNVEFDLPSQLAIVGPAGSGKEELTLVLAGLIEPQAGKVPRRRRGPHPARLRARPAFRLCQHDQLHLRRQPPGQPPVRPEVPAAAAAPAGRGGAAPAGARVHEAEAVRQLPYDPQADWVDYAAGRNRRAGRRR